MSGPNGDPNISIDTDDVDEFSDEEYAAINSMLDQINSCLDDLEERNDALNAKLKDLLESNRQARQEFREQQRDAIREPPSSHPSQPAEGDQREQ